MRADVADATAVMEREAGAVAGEEVGAGVRWKEG